MYNPSKTKLIHLSDRQRKENLINFPIRSAYKILNLTMSSCDFLLILIFSAQKINMTPKENLSKPMKPLIKFLSKSYKSFTKESRFSLKKI